MTTFARSADVSDNADSHRAEVVLFFLLAYAISWAFWLEGYVARIASLIIISLKFDNHLSGIILLKQNRSSFKWQHFEPEIMLPCVRWHLHYQLSSRDLQEMMRERGLSVNHTTIFRRVQTCALGINKRIRPHLRLAGASYRVDETYIKVGKSCKSLFEN